MRAESKLPKSIWWAEPRWSYVPRYKKGFASLLQLKMWIRILVVVTLLAALAGYGLKRAFPDFDFDWIGKLTLSVGQLVLGLFCFVGAFFIIPPIIAIDAKGVRRQEGQHVSWRFQRDIRLVTIDLTDQSQPLLKIKAAGKKPFEAGISAKVSPANLADFMRAKLPGLSVVEKK